MYLPVYSLEEGLPTGISLPFFVNGVVEETGGGSEMTEN